MRSRGGGFCCSSRRRGSWPAPARILLGSSTSALGGGTSAPRQRLGSRGGCFGWPCRRFIRGVRASVRGAGASRPGVTLVRGAGGLGSGRRRSATPGLSPDATHPPGLRRPRPPEKHAWISKTRPTHSPASSPSRALSRPFLLSRRARPLRGRSILGPLIFYCHSRVMHPGLVVRLGPGSISAVPDPARLTVVAASD